MNSSQVYFVSSLSAAFDTVLLNHHGIKITRKALAFLIRQIWESFRSPMIPIYILSNLGLLPRLLKQKELPLIFHLTITYTHFSVWSG